MARAIPTSACFMRNDTAGPCGGLQTTRRDGRGPKRRMGRLQANTPRTHGAPGRGVHGRGKGLTTRHSEAVARFQQRARRLHAAEQAWVNGGLESPRRPGESVRASGEGPHHRWTASPNRERHASTVGLRSNRPTRGTEWCCARWRIEGHRSGRTRWKQRRRLEAASLREVSYSRLVLRVLSPASELVSMSLPWVPGRDFTSSPASSAPPLSAP